MTTYLTNHNVDYITFSTEKFTPLDDAFGSKTPTKPKIGNYNTAYHLDCGILVQYHSNEPRMKQHVTINGGTLKTLRNMGFTDIQVLQWLKSLKKPKFGRVDICVTSWREDGKEHEFTPEYCYNISKDKLKSRLKPDKPVVDVEKLVETMYIGQRSTRDRLLRVYDKGLELGNAANEIIRVELESRSGANKIADEVASGLNIAGIIRRYVDFPTDDIWTKIMNHEPLPRTRTDGIEDTSKSDSRWQWLFTSVAPALAAQLVQDRVLPEENERMIQFLSLVDALYNKGAQ